jgi:hypothetical protein
VNPEDVSIAGLLRTILGLTKRDRRIVSFKDRKREHLLRNVAASLRTGVIGIPSIPVGKLGLAVATQPTLK